MNTQTAAEQANVSTGTIRRWCRTGRIVAAKVAGRWVIESLPATEEETMTEETPALRFTVREAPNHVGRMLYRALDTVSGQEYDSSFDRDAMVTRVAAMNAGTPFQAAQANRSTSRRDPVADALGLRSSARPGDCHYCGLDERTCDCR